MENIRQATWEGIGVDVKSAQNLNDVLVKAGLDYTVNTSPIFTDKRIEIPGRVATVRNTDNHVYGIVSDTYKVCQNKDAFDFINYINGDIQFVKAGETDGGLVYIISKLPEMNILGDSFNPYVIFQNGHNGGISIRAAICPLRIVCQNQFSISFRDAANTVTIRHTSTMEGKLIEARQVLSTTADYMGTLNKEAEKYAGIKLSHKDLESILDEFFPITDDMSNRSKTIIDERRSQLMKAYDNNDNQNFKGTAWGIINAVSDYVTHSTPSRKSENWEENRFTYVTFYSPLINKICEFIRAKV